MVTHTVMWKVKDAATNGPLIKEKLEALQELPMVEDIEVGLNTAFSAIACDVILISRFASREDLSAYRTHPDHVKVVEFMKDLVTERYVVDY